jgi:transcriptional regulator with XRE-family HTH domain
MGKAARRRPARLAEKLVAIRTALKLSQNGMVRRLGLEGQLLREDVSRFERGVGGEPPLNILLRYARAISTTGRGEFLEALIDDELDLPDEMPAAPSTLLPRIKAGTAKKISSKRPERKRQSKTGVEG